MVWGIQKKGTERLDETMLVELHSVEVNAPHEIRPLRKQRRDSPDNCIKGVN